MIDEDYVEYGMLLHHSCDLDGDYASIATAWSERTFRQLMDEKQMGNILANKTLQYFPLNGALDGQALIVDLHHLATWSTNSLRARRRIASLDPDEQEAMQAKMVHSLALRTITRDKRLIDYEGRTIQRVRAVPEGADQLRVFITFEGDDQLILYLFPRKQ